MMLGLSIVIKYLYTAWSKKVSKMNLKNVLLAGALILGTAPIVLAQSGNFQTDSDMRVKSVDVEKKITDKAIFADEENKIYYIDFENLSVNLSDIILKDNRGKVLIKEDVFDLPVNSIYELDLGKYAKGKYLIELHSFTGIIRKSIQVR